MTERPLRHIVARATDESFAVPAPFAAHSSGWDRWAVVDHRTPGAVHTGFGINRLAAGGSIDRHLHSFEESFHLLQGTVVCETPEGSMELVAGDYGIIPVGAPHTWRNTGPSEARWADMLAPQPRPDFDDDTFFVDGLPSSAIKQVDPRDPRTRSFGHIAPANMDPGRQTQDMLAVSASMRTALLVYSGITVKMMVDSDLGAQLQTMFMVQYEPNGVAGAHDHPLEETYMIMEGTTVAKFDGTEYLLEPGDIAFAGVGCVHEFANPGPGIVRWLETQAPQPPGRHSYRFARDWTYLRDALGQ
ncbi:MAG: cupin domain-containing protein [Acidimicrobiia bacterium]|nr:cupin domain-containing protein [Acidimicrobiia bacterium]